MAKLIDIGSVLEDNLNNMKEVNNILEKPYRYYKNKYENLWNISFILIIALIMSSTVYAFSFAFSYILYGIRKDNLFLAIAIFTAIIVLIKKINKYNDKSYYVPSKNLLEKMYDSNEIDIKEAGVEGENNTFELLQQLDDSYSIIYGYPITDEKRNDNSNNCELDFLVLGPNGIFIIENKNVTGEIIGKSTDSVLTKRKESYDDIFEEEYKSPIKQVLRQMSIFKRFLAGNDIPDVFIKPVVYFGNENCTVNIENSSNVELLSAEDDLIGFIKSYNGRSFSGTALTKFIDLSKRNLSRIREKNRLECEEKIDNINRYIRSEAFKLS